MGAGAEGFSRKMSLSVQFRQHPAPGQELHFPSTDQKRLIQRLAAKDVSVPDTICPSSPSSQQSMTSYPCPHLGAGCLGKAEGFTREGEVQFLEGRRHKWPFAFGLVDEQWSFLHNEGLQGQCLLQVQLCK